MAKRSIDDIVPGDSLETDEKRFKQIDYIKKHTLDSDEDDSDDEEKYNVLNENDIEGEEDDTIAMDGEVKLTPFNMKEELEEGHFDGDGHYQWNKNNDIKDNWLDNIDWIKMKAPTKADNKNDNSSSSSDTESDSDNTTKNVHKKFDDIKNYVRIFELMKPNESINKTLQRLGGKKLSSAERWRRKKAGIVDPNAQLVIELTELTNEILTKLGNMNVYEETYEMIKRKIAKHTKLSTGTKDDTDTAVDDEDNLDMYADDFDKKENAKLSTESVPIATELEQIENDDILNPIITWEFKWKQDDEIIHGPYSTQQMQLWVTEGYFKDGVYVKKTGENTQFYTSNRIDFELYL